MRVILIAVALLLLVPIGIYAEYFYPDKAMTAELEASGVTNVKLKWRMFSGTIFTRCNHDDATIRTYTGTKDGHYVQGLACYAPWWGATHWDD